MDREEWLEDVLRSRIHWRTKALLVELYPLMVEGSRLREVVGLDVGDGKVVDLEKERREREAQLDS